MTKAGLAATKEFCPSAFGRPLRRLSGLGGTVRAVLLVAGCFAVAGVANAQTASSDPEACVEKCKQEQATCLKQMGTADMCGADYNVCKTDCEKKK